MKLDEKLLLAGQGTNAVGLEYDVRSIYEQDGCLILPRGSNPSGPKEPLVELCQLLTQSFTMKARV